MDWKFEWDAEKASLNLAKHGVDFEDAIYVLEDPRRFERIDERGDYGEDRYVTLGLVYGVELVVVYTLRGDAIRLISARKANANERIEYWANR